MPIDFCSIELKICFDHLSTCLGTVLTWKIMQHTSIIDNYHRKNKIKQLMCLLLTLVYGVNKLWVHKDYDVSNHLSVYSISMLYIYICLSIPSVWNKWWKNTFPHTKYGLIMQKSWLLNSTLFQLSFLTYSFSSKNLRSICIDNFLLFYWATSYLAVM